jgi:hypothetical protein
MARLALLPDERVRTPFGHRFSADLFPTATHVGIVLLVADNNNPILAAMARLPRA